MKPPKKYPRFPCRLVPSSCPHRGKIKVTSTAAAFCISPDFFNHSLNAANFDLDRCFNYTNSTCHEYWFTNAPNITAVPPSPIENGLDIWVWKSKTDLLASLPVSKPVIIECPMPVCAFGISGPYADMQRYLVYTNLIFAAAAAAFAPILRGIAQICLATTGVSATAHCFTMIHLWNRYLIDMDFIPALVYAHSGIVASLPWLLQRLPGLAETTKHVVLMQGLSFIILMFYYMVFLGVLMTSAKTLYPGAALLESDTAFRLTSV